MTNRIAPCLWFDGNAEEAVDFYTSIFPGSRVVDVMRHGDAGPGPKGTVLAITFELEGQEFLALNGGPQFHFTPAISLFVKCRTQDEVDGLWHRLSAGGEEVQCGWLTDRFGVSWQIVPTALGDMLRDRNEAKAANVMRAMMQMVKLDLAQLRRAYEQG